MNKTCECCGVTYTPAGKKPGSILWDRRKYCSRTCAQTIHGAANTFEYRVWTGMISRCNNPRATGFKYYGGRGISVCDRWRISFDAFLKDMGPAPSVKHSIERKDVNGSYEPRNCLWLEKNRQARNTRRTKNIAFQGREQSLAAWCEELGLPYWRTHSRIHKLGWPVERALMEAVQPKSERHLNFKHEGPATLAYGP